MIRQTFFIVILKIDDKDSFDDYRITNPPAPIGVEFHLIFQLNDADHVPQEVHLVIVENLIVREGLIKIWWMKTKAPQQAGHPHQIDCKQFPMTAVQILLHT